MIAERTSRAPCSRLAGLLFCATLVGPRSPAPAGEVIPRVKPAGHVYVEAENCFCLTPATVALPGFLGTGYRHVRQPHGRSSLDITLAVPGNPKGTKEYLIWVRAYRDGTDRRVAVEWKGGDQENRITRLDATHVGSVPRGFRWEKAGTLTRWRTYHQLRLLPVEGSSPIVDAVLITYRTGFVPREDLAPRDDPALVGNDGQGSTRLSSSRVVAGEPVDLTTTYTVGTAGIAAGGALLFYIDQGWALPDAVGGDATQEAWLDVSTSRSGVALQVDCHKPGKGYRCYSGELRHQHEVLVRFTGGALRRGDTVTIRYRGTVQSFVQSADDFHNRVRAWYSPALPFGVWTDADGDGIYWPVAAECCHALEVVAGTPTQLHVTVPSIVRADEPVSIRVAALDRLRNATPSYRGRLRLSAVALRDGEPTAHARIATGDWRIDGNGWARLQDVVQFTAAGAYAVRVTDGEGREGLSNPIKCTAEEPSHRIYWGDLHTHHRRCDGLRRFEEAVAHGRDIAGLDVVSLTPHACYLTEGDFVDLWYVDERLNQPGRFVTLFSYEWAAAGRGASHSILYSRTPIPIAFRAFGGGNVVRGRPALYDLLAERGLEVVEVPHHVGGITDRDPRYQKAIEIYSQHESRERGVLTNLNDGLQATLFGTSDNHSGHPGLQPLCSRFCVLNHYGGLTAFLLPSLSRDEVFRAIDERRTYATSDCRIIADVEVNGHGMGSEFTLRSPANPRLIRIEALASEPIHSVELLWNGRTLRSWFPGARVVRVSHTDDRPFGGPLDYYYVRVARGPDRMAFVTPVWVRYEQPAMTPAKRFAEAAERTENLALGKAVTVSFPGKITAGRPGLLTDGELDSHLGHGVQGRVWVQVDLGQVRTLGAVRLWNYFRDGRTFHGGRIAISATGEFRGEEMVVHDSERDGEYAETTDGQAFLFEPSEARYIRSWLNGSTSNPGSQWVELEAYAPLPNP